MTGSSLSQYPQQSHANFIFLYADDNYLMRMLNDTNFMGNTMLTECLTLASKNDPFVLRPLREERTSANTRFMEVVDCDQDFKLRMTKALEYLASDKAEELRSKILPTTTKPIIHERTNEA